MDSKTPECPKHGELEQESFTVPLPLEEGNRIEVLKSPYRFYCCNECCLEMAEGRLPEGKVENAKHEWKMEFHGRNDEMFHDIGSHDINYPDPEQFF